MKTKVRNSVKKRKSLKKATKKASKKTTKRQKKLLNYKNKNTRKNKRGGDAASVAVPIAAAAMIAGLAYKSQNIKNKTNKNNTPKYQYSYSSKNSPPITKNGNGNGNGKNSSPIDVFLKKHNLVKEKIPDDGNCLFTAFLKILNKSEPVTVEAVKDLRTKMVEWMQDGDFWDQHGTDILAQDSFATGVNKPMYSDYNDYVSQMTRIDSDPERPRAQFGGFFEIFALFEMHKEELKDIYAPKEEGALLLWITENDDGTLFLQTFPHDDTMNLKTNINTNLPILLLLKSSHFVILKPNSDNKQSSHLNSPKNNNE